MALLTLSLGSNVEPAYHITQALDGLAQSLGALQCSSVFESKAVGFEGGNFLNMVVAAHTEMSLLEISQMIKALEIRHGRQRNQARFTSRTLDIDILTLASLHGEFHGIVLPRPEITVNAYVLWPLSEVLPAGKDPISGQSYAELWAMYDRSRQQLWPVDFHWHGRRISSA